MNPDVVILIVALVQAGQLWFLAWHFWPSRSAAAMFSALSFVTIAVGVSSALSLAAGQP